ncbi:MAG TPA: hypothetical protein VHO25_14000 [Polyangiaceae bacterium]|nr:hypothetical protein [Polyangiaceae bacterium]
MATTRLGATPSSRYVILDPAPLGLLVKGYPSRRQFAAKCKISVEALRNALQGRKVERSTWLNIAKAMNVDRDMLLHRTGSSPSCSLALPADQVLKRTLPKNLDLVLTGKQEIAALARRLRLFKAPQLNAHLTYTTGDISFWHEQAAPRRQAYVLWAEFLGRRLTLEDADSKDQFYPRQGHLSHAAQPLVAALLRWLTAQRRRTSIGG